MDHSALGLVSSTRFTMRNEKYNELDKDLDSATIIIGNTSHCIGLTFRQVPKEPLWEARTPTDFDHSFPPGGTR